jgi:hypothetical protein
MNSDDETPWWCQLLWPWFGRPWYAEIEVPDACWAAIGRQFAWQAGELTDDLAGDDRPGEGYLAKAERLTATRYQAEEIIRHESGPLTSDDEDDGDQDDEPASAGERPVVIGARPSVVARGRCRAAGKDRRSRVGLTLRTSRAPTPRWR